MLIYHRLLVPILQNSDTKKYKQVLNQQLILRVCVVILEPIDRSLVTHIFHIFSHKTIHCNTSRYINVIYLDITSILVQIFHTISHVILKNIAYFSTLFIFTLFIYMVFISTVHLHCVNFHCIHIDCVHFHCSSTLRSFPLCSFPHYSFPLCSFPHCSFPLHSFPLCYSIWCSCILCSSTMCSSTLFIYTMSITISDHLYTL